LTESKEDFENNDDSMAILQKRACVNCHAAKVKCVRVEGHPKCTRCERLGLKCVEHISRQGQGTRRRKKVKTKVMENENTVDEALAITSALTPISTSNNNMTPICPISGDIIDRGCQNPIMNLGTIGPSQTASTCYNHIIQNGQNEEKICSGMNSLEIEDTLICKSLTNGLGRNHFGLNFLIREWVSLAFSRRSFALLGRASFIAVKMQIPMDDIISNQSPFAAATDSEPMDFLARDLLLSKDNRKTLGYPVDLLEVPWDMLEAVQIDQIRAAESVRNRWIGMRWTSQGTCRFYTSPLFARDFATVEEVGKVWESNNKEVIDLFMPKSEKASFAQQLFNLIFVNNRPHMGCFVTKKRFKVLKRNNPEPIDAYVISTIKFIDLDSMIHYFEIQFLDRTSEHLMGVRAPSVNKREHMDVYVDNVIDDPLTLDGIEFTDIEMTDEMEDFLKLLNDS